MGYLAKAGVVQVSRREVTRLRSLGWGCWGAESSLCSCTSGLDEMVSLEPFPVLTFL